MHSEAETKLVEEARAFDRQIEDRIANGHVPDLRTVTPCDWFYNNPWRRPAYVQLDFGEQFELIAASIRQYTAASPMPRVLEIGCGPGYMSLELARAGFDVTGIDLSEKCVEIAGYFAGKDPYLRERGPLRYLSGDFLTMQELSDGYFDAVVFLGALHHFPDQVRVLARAEELLKPAGVILVHEPVRDRVTRGNAIFMHLLRVLISLNSGFYRSYPIPRDAASREREFEQLFAQLRYETEDGHNVQSANDNEAGYAEMFPALIARFDQLTFDWRYAFFHEFIGGLRFDEKLNVELAHYLREVDRELCREGVLSATEFFFVGRKRG